MYVNTTASASRLAHELSRRLADLTQLLRREVRVDGFSPTMTAVLAKLDRDGAMRVSELAEFAQVSQPTMTSLLRRMTDEGTVSRRADPSDQRAVVIDLTDAGRALVGEIRERRARALDARLAPLAPAERDALTAAMPALDTLLTTWRKDERA